MVLDASFRPRWTRELARDLADRCGVPFTFVECKADRNTCLERLKRRARERLVSDGRVAIFQDFVDRWEEVVELDPSQHLRIDTSLPLEHNMCDLRARISMWPPGLRG